MSTVACLRRSIRFHDASEVVDDVLRLQVDGHEARGNWNLAQVVEHLARGIDCSYEGFDFTVPWLARVVLGRLAKQRFLYESMPSGYQFRSETVLVPPTDTDLPYAIEHLRCSMDRLQNDPPTQPHPLLGKLTHKEWQFLALRHAELHLSFIHPLEYANS